MAVVCGGYEACRPDYAIHRSTFPFYSLEFVAGGKGLLRLGGGSHVLNPGVVFSYEPGIVQDIATDADDPLLKYFVDFTGTKAAALLEHSGLNPGPCGRVFPPGEVHAALDQLIRDGTRGTGLARPLTAALVEYLLLKITETRAPRRVGHGRALATYQRCRQHIADNCDRLRSLGQIARECRIDRAYLCRLFRRYEQQSPHQLLMLLKMNLAAERLQTPEILVKTVAADLGFDDPFHFSRTFKKVFGISPDAFRRLR